MGFRKEETQPPESKQNHEIHLIGWCNFSGTGFEDLPYRIQLDVEEKNTAGDVLFTFLEMGGRTTNEFYFQYKDAVFKVKIDTNGKIVIVEPHEGSSPDLLAEMKKAAEKYANEIGTMKVNTRVMRRAQT